LDTGPGEDWRGDGLVLVVEDEALVLRFATNMLAALGFEVVAAEDGPRALHQLGCHGDGLALVLLDLSVPGMTAEQFLDELERTTIAVPVVATSGLDVDEMAARFAGRRVAGYLQKPFRLAQLREAVRGALTAS
jgi:CheY-like chemotaxis protein